MTAYTSDWLRPGFQESTTLLYFIDEANFVAKHNKLFTTVRLGA